MLSLTGRSSSSRRRTSQSETTLKICNRQDTSIANLTERMADMTEMMRELQAAIGGHRGPRGQGEAETAAQRATCAIKLDLPKFTGVDPEGWIFQAEEYFAFHGILDDSRIQIAGLNMTREALGWMRGLRQNNLLSTWERFVEDMRERFGGSEFEDKLQELCRIKQITSVANYLEKFEELLNEISGQSEASLIIFFISELKPELKNELNLAKPTTLRRVFALAKAHEAHRIPGRFGGNSGTGINTEPLLKSPPNGAKAVPIVCKMLTVEERTAKRLCFNCDEFL